MFLLISHTADLNGAERSLADLAIGLKQQRLDCMVLMPEDGPLRRLLQQLDIPVKIHSLPRPQKNIVHLLKFVLLWLPTVLWLGWWMKKQGVLAVYNNTIDGLYGPFSAKLVGVPCMWHVREVKPRNKKVRRFFTYLLARWTFCTVFNSRGTMFAYDEGVHSHWRVIYNGVVVPKHLSVDRYKENGKVVVGFVGQMVHHKRPDRFVKAFAIARETVPHLSGIMAGSGVLLDEVLLLVSSTGLESRIKMLGYVESIHDVFKQMDILVLTSEYEPFGRVLIEAMAVGCPVVAAKVGGVPEVVGECEGGYLISAGDVQGYADAIIALANDSGLRENMGKAGRKRVLENFSMEQYRERLIALLQEAKRPFPAHPKAN